MPFCGFAKFTGLDIYLMLTEASSDTSTFSHEDNSFYVRFQVLTAASMKMAVVWDLGSCSLVETDRRFRGVCCLHHQDEIVMKLV
jgi:hypothetical protein